MGKFREICPLCNIFVELCRILGEIMENKKMDIRIKKTKKSIYNAIAVLLTEKDLKHVTIKEICEIAEINRKTFYNYYSGAYDVIDEIENNVISILCDSIEQMNIDEVFKTPYIMFEKLNEIISTDLEFYSHLISKKSNYGFVDKVEAVLKEKTKSKLKTTINLSSEKLDIMLDYAYSGMLRVYQKWFNNEYKKPLEQIAQEISNICFGGINSIINEA